MKHIPFATALLMAGSGSAALAGGYTVSVSEPSPAVREETTSPDRPAGPQGSPTEQDARRPSRDSAASPCSSVFDRATPACRN